MISSTVEVEKETDFEFKLTEPSPNDFEKDSSIFPMKRITGWSIYNLEARRRETETKWIEGFEKQYGVSLNHLIEIYNGCLSRGRNRVPSSRTKYVSTELKREGISLSRSQVDQILVRIRECHNYYSSLLKD